MFRILQLKSSGSVQFYETKFTTLRNVIAGLFCGYNLIFYLTMFGSLIIVGNRFSEGNDAEMLNLLFILIDNIAYQNFFLGFMISLYSIYFTLDVIGSWLKSVVKQDIAKEKNDVQVLRLVSALIDSLCDVMEVGQKSNRMNIVFFVHYFALLGVICTYCSIFFVVFESNAEFLAFFSMAAIWISYNFMFFAWTFIFSSLIKKKCQVIELTCIKFLTRSDSTPKIDTSVQLISLQLYHRKLIFSCKMFNVDWIFLFHLIAESFSYLVIIFQFDINLYK